MFVMSAQLQRGNFAGAKETLASVVMLPTPEAVVGAELWADYERRLRLCESAGVGNFIQGYIASLGLSTFLESGILTPSVPPGWQTAINEFDDERYLLGIVDASRELERYAVNRGQVLDLRSIQVCLRGVQSLEQALMQFDFRNGDLRRRFDGVKYAVKKLETLAYEVDLAKKRALCGAAGTAATPEVEAGSIAGEPPLKRQRTCNDGKQPAESEKVCTDQQPTPALDLALLGAIKKRYDLFDSMREQTIKRSRDVLKGAKNAIFALQRKDFRKADAALAQCTKDACGIHKDLVGKAPSLRGGGFSAALEEFVEALAYRAFSKDLKLLSRSELQEASGLHFPLTLVEYLGGLMDLTGEVGRLAVRAASGGRQAVGDVELCLACVDAVYTGIQDLPFLPGGLGKKVGPLKGTLTKIEGILYELALLSHGGVAVKAPGAGHAEGDEPEEAAGSGT